MTTRPKMKDQKKPTDQPYISASENLPEITLKSFVLSVLLAVVLGAANAYLGLFAGMTVSASIPAAVISMAIFRLFKTSNILENNMVQTVASAGEAIAGGVIFTMPALLILGTWQKFNYWETTLIAALGGVLGMLFTIPLRRAMIVENPLQFPEGVATAEVLKVGDRGGAGVKTIAAAGAIGALFKLGETGLRLWSGVVEKAALAGNTILYVGTNLSPALVGVGYIVGLNIAILIFLGGVVNWYIAVPILSNLNGVPAGQSAIDAANTLWSQQTRYIGVGSMLVGGLWALLKLRKSLVAGIQSGIEAYRQSRKGVVISRTERDVPMQWMAVALVVSIIPLYMVAEYVTGMRLVSVLIAVLMLGAAFLFSAVAAYMAGVVGSSNSPISGVTIATILCSALLLLAVLGRGNPAGPAAAILIGGVVCCAAAIAGDNLQDLKSGRIVGATPYKQQLMNTVGIIAAALVMAPTLTLLLNAYGIGAPTPEHPKPLPAPQATLMASVARGVFQGGLPINMLIVGMLVAAVVIFIDSRLERRGSAFRMPVLAMAIGIYLPLQLSVAIFLGGLIAWAAGRVHRTERHREAAERNGVLFAAGLITGEALIGIGMAIPIVIAGRADVMAFWGVHEWNWPGMVLLALVMYLLYRTASRPPLIHD
jgi:putative OPT family oligopeptide transporter